MSRFQRAFGMALLGAALALSAALPLGAAAAPRPVDIIYNFTAGADGASPGGGLIRDTAGNFYGTAAQGGNGGFLSGCGVVFKLSPLGAVTTLYAFTDGIPGGRDGCDPEGKLIVDAAGNLYGTTSAGGADVQGVVFKLTPGGEETVLHFFRFAGDGSGPLAGLTMDAAGNFYGTTDFGGPSNRGTVFKVAPGGHETVLHAFTGGADGSIPTGGVIMDKHGNLYGDTLGGTIFKITPNGNFSVLHSFTGGADGSAPQGGLIMDKQGALYGTTTKGGGSCDCGVVFKLTPDGTETVLHTFTGRSDGADPTNSLIMDRQGVLYGVTHGGGRFHLGTVFQLSPDGTETVLHSFAGSPDGASPKTSLILSMNKLYGTTSQGGTGGCNGGCGVVFEVRRAK